MSSSSNQTNPIPRFVRQQLAGLRTDQISLHLGAKVALFLLSIVVSVIMFATIVDFLSDDHEDENQPKKRPQRCSRDRQEHSEAHLRDNRSHSFSSSCSSSLFCSANSIASSSAPILSGMKQINATHKTANTKQQQNCQPIGRSFRKNMIFAQSQARAELKGLKEANQSDRYPALSSCGCCCCGCCCSSYLSHLTRTASSCLADRGQRTHSSGRSSAVEYDDDACAWSSSSCSSHVIAPTITCDHSKHTSVHSSDSLANSEQILNADPSQAATCHHQEVGTSANLITNENGPRLASTFGAKFDIDLAKQMLLAFSLRQSWRQIFHVEDEDKRTSASSFGDRRESIASLHGLRFISMIWVIVIHSYNFAQRWIEFSNNNILETIYQTATSQLVANGTFACDSFFFAAGFLLPYLAFRPSAQQRRQQQQPMKPPTTISSAVDHRHSYQSNQQQQQQQHRKNQRHLFPAYHEARPQFPSRAREIVSAVGQKQQQQEAEHPNVGDVLISQQNNSYNNDCFIHEGHTDDWHPAHARHEPHNINRLNDNTHHNTNIIGGDGFNRARVNNSTPSSTTSQYCEHFAPMDNDMNTNEHWLLDTGIRAAAAISCSVASTCDRPEHYTSQHHCLCNHRKTLASNIVEYDSTADSNHANGVSSKPNAHHSQEPFTISDLTMNILHRYLRMMPLMMAIIGLCSTLLRYLGDGPNWRNSTMMYDEWCRKNWWVNLMFLQNFVDRENMCLSHSWYSAVDIQLFLFGQLCLFVLFKSRALGLTMIAILLSISPMITGILTILHHLPAVPLMANVVSEQVLNIYFGEIYIKPYCRASPYFIGMSLAYLMRTTSLGQLKLKRWQVILGWLLAFTTFAAILLAMQPAMNGNLPNDVESALYSSLSRPLWACAIGWTIFACITRQSGPISNLLGAKCFIPFSRLTYPAFLIHPVVMAVFYGSRQTSFHFSHYLMLYLILGNIVITYVTAFILASIFELPILSLERVLKGRFCRRQ